VIKAKLQKAAWLLLFYEHSSNPLFVFEIFSIIPEVLDFVFPFIYKYFHIYQKEHEP